MFQPCYHVSTRPTILDASPPASKDNALHREKGLKAGALKTFHFPVYHMFNCCRDVHSVFLFFCWTWRWFTSSYPTETSSKKVFVTTISRTTVVDYIRLRYWFRTMIRWRLRNLYICQVYLVVRSPYILLHHRLCTRWALFTRALRGTNLYLKTNLDGTRTPRGKMCLGNGI